MGYLSATHGSRSLFTALLTCGSARTIRTTSSTLGWLPSAEAETAGEAAPDPNESLSAGPSSRAPVPPVPQAETERPRAASTATAVITAFDACLAPGPGPAAVLRPRNAPAPCSVRTRGRRALGGPATPAPREAAPAHGAACS